MEISKVGVRRLRPDGSRDRPDLRAGGLGRGRPRGEPGEARRRDRQDRQAARPRGREGEDGAGRRGRGARPNHADARLLGSRRLRPRDRGDHRGPGREARDVEGGRRDGQGRRHLRHQHLLALGRRAGRGDLAAGALPRAPLLQPGAGDAAARGRARGRRPATRPSQLGFELGEKLGKTTVAARDNRGFIVNRLLVPYMLDAIRAREQGVGLDRGHRHRDEGGRQPPDGAADARRLRRPRHPGLDRRRHARGLRRGALRGAADAARSWSRPATTDASPGVASTTTRARRPTPVDLGI